MFKYGTFVKISDYGWNQRYDTLLLGDYRDPLDIQRDDVWEVLGNGPYSLCRNVRTGLLHPLLADVDEPVIVEVVK